MSLVSLTGGSPWGFRLVGGCDFRASLAISKVTPGGKASRAGLQPGDVITSINSLDTAQMTHLEAQNIVKATGASLVLGISSNGSAPAAVAPPAPQPTNKTYQSSTTLPIGKLSINTPPTAQIGKPTTFSINTSVPPPPPVATKSPPAVATKPWAPPKRPSDFIVNTPTFDDDEPLPPPPPSLSSPPPPPSATLPSPPATALPPPPPSDFIAPPPSDFVAPPPADFVPPPPAAFSPPPPAAFSPPPPAPKPSNIPPPKQNHAKAMSDLPPPPGSDALSMPKKNSSGSIEELFCEGCGKPILGAYLTTKEGQNWHPECFVCSSPSCKKPLQSIGFIEEKGKRYCSQCYEKYYANACAKCHQKIIGEVMHALNQTWCVNCFVCIACSKPFRDGVFHMEGDKPYCIECFNKLFSTTCKACGFRIEAGDGYVEAIESSWHETCFNCIVCQCDLKNCGFFAVKGRPVCSIHKNAAMVS